MTKEAAVSFGNMLKNAGLQGSNVSDHCMTTGFGPFELPTCGQLRDFVPEIAATTHWKFVLQQFPFSFATLSAIHLTCLCIFPNPTFADVIRYSVPSLH